MKLITMLTALTLATTCNKQNMTTIFMGDSITDEWFRLRPDYFANKPFVNKGISGQTTAQMLSRFRADVLDRKPGMVIILGGTNDIAQNQGPVELETIFQNIVSMTGSARDEKIKVILCSVLPAYDYPWKPGVQPDKKIPALNQMLRDYAEKNNIVYADFFSAMKDENNGIRKELARDGVHPTVAGYKVMEPLLEQAIREALRR